MEVLLILVVAGVIILAIKIAMTNPKESSNIQNQPDKLEIDSLNSSKKIFVILD